MFKVFDPEKTYTPIVWDITIAVHDDDADDYVRNEDGSVKIFDVPNLDCSYIAEGFEIDTDELRERKND